MTTQFKHTIIHRKKKTAIILSTLFLMFILATVANANPGILGVFDFNCNAGAHCVNARNEGNGVGLFGFTRSGTIGAVRGVAAASNTQGVGVWGKSAHTAVRGEGGLFGGVFTGSRGMYAEGTNFYGVHAVSQNDDAVRGLSYGDDNTDYGGDFRSTDGRGLYADGATPQWDAYIANCARIGAITYGNCGVSAPYSAGMAVIALNAGAEPLAPGDILVFKGMDEVAGVPDVVVLVEKATGGTGEVVIGVMKEAYALAPAEAALVADLNASTALPTEFDPTGGDVFAEAGGDSGQIVSGNAEPGGLLFVQIQGIALINVDASAHPIVAGENLVVSQAGRATAAAADLAEESPDSKILGFALESLAAGSGAVYVMLNR